MHAIHYDHIIGPRGRREARQAANPVRRPVVVTGGNCQRKNIAARIDGQHGVEVAADGINLQDGAGRAGVQIRQHVITRRPANGT